MTAKKWIATYRLQMNYIFNFTALTELIPYFASLGISELYLSPITTALPKSLHGYDVIDYERINPELGNISSWRKMLDTAEKYRLSLLLDFVPNHMAFNKANMWLADLLEKRDDSKYKNFFDLSFNDGQPRYRRFFDINELICLRMENNEVFSTSHQLLIQLLKNSSISGLRIDHIDGLYETTEYLNKLRENIPKKKIIFVEKILAMGEPIYSEWPIEGTTGYDFLNQLNSVFISETGYKKILKKYQKITNSTSNWKQIRYQSKKKIILSIFSNEFHQLFNSLFKGSILKLIEGINPDEIRKGLLEISSYLSIYRTYVDKLNPNKIEKKYLLEAIKLSFKNNSDLSNELLEFFKKIFLLKKTKASIQEKKEIIAWLKQWQVFTGPVMAKGFEDTTCYIFNPLISLNEVGSDPNFVKQLGNSTKLHQFFIYRQQHYPLSLNTTTTHDTKHSEDFRSRINILSHHADAWNKTLTEWVLHNKKYKKQVGEILAPDPSMEILIYQTLLGMYSSEKKALASIKERIFHYLSKAAREAKIHSNWQSPNADYEKALVAFINNILKDPIFINRFLFWFNLCDYLGKIISFSQLIIKIFSPGIPDFYQGSETLDYRVTDPDNRNFIDYEKNKNLLQKSRKVLSFLKKNNFYQTMNNPQNSELLKLFFMSRCLNIRKKYLSLLLKGKYIPLICEGKNSNNLFSYAREDKKNLLIVIVPIATSQQYNHTNLSTMDWSNTNLVLPKLDHKRYKNLLTNELVLPKKEKNFLSLELSNLFRFFPYAVLAVDQ